MHLPHHSPAMGLYRDFADAELRGHLFVQAALHDEAQNFALAAAKRRIALLQQLQFHLAAERNGAAIEPIPFLPVAIPRVPVVTPPLRICR